MKVLSPSNQHSLAIMDIHGQAAEQFSSRNSGIHRRTVAGDRRNYASSRTDQPRCLDDGAGSRIRAGELQGQGAA